MEFLFSIEKVRAEDSMTVPRKAHKGDTGFDLYSSKACTLRAGVVTKVPLNFRIKEVVEEGYWFLIATKSSFAVRNITVLGGIIDGGYRGEIIVLLSNLSSSDLEIKENQAVAQLIIQKLHQASIVGPFEEKPEASTTIRGSDGFGSTHPPIEDNVNNSGWVILLISLIDNWFN